ncbi:MAG: glycoside hydrolase family 3 [Candidatus Cloacimonetes bacterium]|nr:glycoside hydrolase family 3 [Candidatus Cloacimonadota bacterium]
MLIVGFSGSVPDSNPAFLESLNKYNPGGVVLYNRNISSPTQLHNLISYLQDHSSTPLFIATDQEGGQVARLNPQNGFPEIASARAIGNINRISETSLWAETIARNLAEQGINLNLAPVLDLDLEFSSPAIGKFHRSFSHLPQIVTEHARIFCQTMNRYKIYNCLKHFPGHGSATTDTHSSTADVTASWNPAELEPYQKLISENAADMIMVSHVINRNYDKLYPASLSSAIISDLLRDRMGWQGIVITDDLQMNAISKYYSLAESLRLAILAGNDLLLFGNTRSSNQVTISQLLGIINQLVLSGEIPQSLIERSNQRIRQLKAKFIDI